MLRTKSFECLPIDGLDDLDDLTTSSPTVSSMHLPSDIDNEYEAYIAIEFDTQQMSSDYAQKQEPIIDVEAEQRQSAILITMMVASNKQRLSIFYNKDKINNHAQEPALNTHKPV